MLKIDSVELSFDGRQVISGCYLNVVKGETVGLLGRNGSGKSSLLKIIFGALQAQYKHLKIDDIYVKSGFLTKEIAYLPQERFLPFFLLVKELLMPIERFKDEEAIYKLRDKRLRDLSEGELRIVECFWVLSLGANYILLDEPFKGLSPLNIEIVQKHIQQCKINKGIIITDHTYQPLFEVADRLVLMHNNSIYNINSLKDLVLYKYLPSI
ncbi:MAG TPA: ABC transporter ATP-binding protein [Pelobium sp.]|jgi:ABC-type multidrug transport system ATPase subunit|nr:ABC transporter ATP-binding protein [Pelobium sp.]